MTLAKAIRIVTCLNIGLLTAATLARGQTGLPKDQIAQHEQKLSEARATKSKRNMATELNTLGPLYRETGQPQKALQYLNEALQIERDSGNFGAQALTMTFMGRVYTDLGQEQTALDLLNQALPLFRSSSNRPGEALALDYIGRVYSDLAQEDKALDFLNQALKIFREQGRRSGEANTLANIGKVYTDTSQGPKALEILNQALPIWREIGDRGGEALTLGLIGETYADMGQMQKTVEAYRQALSIWGEIGNRQGEANALDYLGRTYGHLGQKQTALDYFNQALPIWREVGNRSGEALDLNDIGRVYADIGQSQKALDFYNQSLAIWSAVGNRRGEAMTMNNLSRAWFDLGDFKKTLDINFQALPIWREVKEGRGEAMALSGIGMAYNHLGQPQTAFPYTLAALNLAKAAGDPDMQGGIDTAMMVGFANQNRLEEAIFFGLDAVNSYQEIRKNMAGLDKDLQAGFAQSRSATYRTLAELLVETDRLGEAEQVLDLLKEQELKDIVRGASPDAAAKAQPLALSAAQQTALDELNSQQQKTIALEDLSMQYAALKAKASRTPAEEAQLKSLSASLTQGIAEEFAYFNNTIFPGLEGKSGAGRESAGSEASRQSFLQDTLAKLGPHVLGIRILMGQNHVYAIVVTAKTRKRVELTATPALLRAKVFEALESLTARANDPKPILSQLYAMVVAPIEPDLKALETPAAKDGSVPTVLWSLDDALRYLPMSALYDGHRYMVERFKNVLFTPESYGHMTDSPLTNGTKPSVLAMGLSKSYGGLPALPGVMPELDAVVHDPADPASHGPMEGRLLPNEQFTLAAMKTELGEGKSFPVVHIASHFVVETGSGVEPFLMMGGEGAGDAKGYEWSLSDMEHSTVAFHGTRLLTLSACSTAKDYKTRDGTEMDSLGMIAQQKDAEAVLATMWDVNDASTSRLMSDFYTRWVKNPAAGKAEALRQAQLALLHDSDAATPNSGKQRGPQLEQEETSAQRESKYSHPFFWAPFVLIGNYQ